MSEAAILEALRDAAQRRERAEQERHAASAELRKRVQEAHTAGIGPTRIAQEAGLSRQAVYESLGQQPS
jgi:DNA-binding phage protein